MTPPLQLPPDRRVAMVGWTNSPTDLARASLVLELMQRYDLPIFGLMADYVDLSEGRDFLREPFEYKAVVLHHLYRGDVKLPPMWGSMRTSFLQSQPVWRSRLMATRAEVIIAFGGVGEIGGEYIRELPSYTWRWNVLPDVSLYTK